MNKLTPDSRIEELKAFGYEDYATACLAHHFDESMYLNVSSDPTISQILECDYKQLSEVYGMGKVRIENLITILEEHDISHKLSIDFNNYEDRVISRMSAYIRSYYKFTDFVIGEDSDEARNRKKMFRNTIEDMMGTLDPDGL